MKLIYMVIVLLLAVAVAPFIAQSQTVVEFTYDNSGNRITRTVISMKSTTIGNGELGEQSLKPLEDQIGLQETRIYPNPTKGLLRIDFPSLDTREAMVQVYDSHGKLIIQQSASISNEVDLSSCPSGFYIMIIRIGQDKKEWKIIRE